MAAGGIKPRVTLLLAVALFGATAGYHAPQPIAAPRSRRHVAPLAWAIVNLKAFPSVVYVMTLGACACAAAGAVVRVYML